MADELKQTEEPLAESETRVTELEGLVSQKDEELAATKAHLVELEATLAGKDGEIASLKQGNAETEATLAHAGQSLAEAMAAYRTMVVQANPGVMAELISGESIQTVNESLKQAKALVSRVKQGLETEIRLTRVPAGAPERAVRDLSSLSAREKIQYAIGGKK